MVLATNIKGYINDNEWGVYEPAPTLLTYEEILAMATTEGHPYTNTLSELNLYPNNYYTEFNNGGNITDKYINIGLTGNYPGMDYNFTGPDTGRYDYYLIYLENQSGDYSGNTRYLGVYDDFA